MRGIAAMVGVLVLAAPAGAQEHHHGHEVVGQVSFPISCNAAAQQWFELGVARLHSFWFDQADNAFEEAAAADPDCAMAHWGRALVQLGNPIAGVPPAAQVRAGQAAVARARAIGAPTARERGYIEAARVLYDDEREPDGRARLRAYENTMRRLAAAHPADAEAAIFFSLARIANADLSDLEYTALKEAASILNPLFEQQPEHPGLAHYIIHAFDAPPIAHLGLDAARRYAEIAPAAPHALHMPSHIFTRLGYWDESIASNRAAADAEGNSAGQLHPLDYLVYAYLQQGRDDDARRAIQEADELVAALGGRDAVITYNYTAMHARFAVERGDWRAAAALQPAPERAPPFIAALTHYARAVGSARSGDAAAARSEVERLDALHERQVATGDQYWSRSIDVQRRAARAWLLHAEGRYDDAVRLATEAADIEETFEKHAVTPGPIMPARELLGELLLELDRPAEALEAFRQVMRREPNRARSGELAKSVSGRNH